MNDLPETMNIPRGTLARELEITTTVITSPRDPPSCVSHPATNLIISRTANTPIFTALQMWEGVPLHRVSADNLSLKNLCCTAPSLTDGPESFQKAGKPNPDQHTFFPKVWNYVLLENYALNPKAGFLLDS